MERVDKGDYVGSLLLDFYKAFDTVPHQLLNFFTELQVIGCSSDSITWLGSRHFRPRHFLRHIPPVKQCLK